MEVEERGHVVHACALEDEHSMSGLSDCLVELEVEDEERGEIPFRSYLDDTCSMVYEDFSTSVNPPQTEIPLSIQTLSHPLLSPDSVHTQFIPHGHIQHCYSGKDVRRFGEMYGDQQPQGNYPEVPNSLMSPENHTPTRPSFLSGGSKSRTPNTLMRLQEKHRENERVRHHTLIKSMKAVCSKVPGYDETAKETKVVMMQRVVDYICHLEHHIQGLSDELGIQLDLSNTFLTTKIRKTASDRNRQISTGSNYYRPPGDPVLAAAYIPESIEMMDRQIAMPKTPSNDLDQKLKLRRQKISSPTVGSSSDATVPLMGDFVGSQSSLSSEDSAKPTPSNIPFVDEMRLTPSSPWISADPYDVFNVHPKDEYLNPDNSLGFDQSDDFGVSSSFRFGSPLGTESLSGFSNSENKLPEEDLKAVNPDRVLQMKSGPLLQEKLIQLIEKKKEFYLDRPPLTPITNMAKKEGTNKVAKCLGYEEEQAQALTPIIDKNLRSDIGRKDDNYFVSYVPYMWKFHDMAMTRRQKAAAARIELQTEKENQEVSQPKKAEEKCKPAKVDLRKTSWMNGFMMFSRINRRTFIEANPGVHTSHISKMMGHTWRNMPEDEQKPYKEKAKKYMEYMQKSFEEEVFQGTGSTEGGADREPKTEVIAEVSCDTSSGDAATQVVPENKMSEKEEILSPSSDIRGKLKQKAGAPRRRKTSVVRVRSSKVQRPGVSLLKKTKRNLQQVKLEPFADNPEICKKPEMDNLVTQDIPLVPEINIEGGITQASASLLSF